MKFSKETRQLSIEKMKDRTLDLLIVGGGITGAGVALQSAASGLETGLIEMQDFAAGTSSRSTKLVHGGLRYLKNFDIEVVNDTVTERAVVQQIAPHIPKPDPMLLPVYDEEGTTFDMFRLKVAMDLYDSLAGVTNTAYANTTLSKEEIINRVPAIQQEDLQGGGNYLDYNNNDARLVIENIKRANEDGALIASRVKAVDYLFNDNNKIKGVIAEDVLTGEQFNIQARYVINTTGPWSDIARNLSADEDEEIKQMRPTKGVHLVVDESRLSVPQPIYFDTGLQDGRMVFVIPRENKTYFGTTDTDYTGDLSHPTVTQEDVDYLLNVVNRRFPDADIALDDVESSWAGLRPLIVGNNASDYNGGNSGKINDESFDQLIHAVGDYLANKTSRSEVEEVIANLDDSLSETNLDPSQVSRGSQLDEDDNGLLTLAGGKLTDYRKMAEGALKEIISKLQEDYGRQFKQVHSKTYPVSGGELNPSNVDSEIEAYARIGVERGLTIEDANYLANLYGSNAPKVFALYSQLENVEGLDVRESLSLQYALREEMALTPVDFFLRRTNHLLFMRDTLDELIDPVLNEMANFYAWTDNEKDYYRDELQKVIDENDLVHLKKNTVRAS